MQEPTAPTSKDIAGMVAILPEFEADGATAGEWHIEEGVMPDFELSPCMSRFIQIAYDGGFVGPFDWTRWQDEAGRYVDNPEAVARADLETIQKLITTHVRKERFCEGHLAGMEGLKTARVSGGLEDALDFVQPVTCEILRKALSARE